MSVFVQADSCVVGLGFWGLCTLLQFCIPIPQLQKHPFPLVNFSLQRKSLLALKNGFMLCGYFLVAVRSC